MSMPLNWLRLSNTTWAESTQFAVGLTTSNFSEVFVDKIAIWCYETFISEKLCARLPELDKLVQLLKQSFSTINKMQIQSKARSIIDGVMFTKYAECQGVKLVYGNDDMPALSGMTKQVLKCSKHLVMQPVPERTLIDTICRMINETSIHEIIHGTHFEDYEFSTHELQVAQMAIMLAGTADIKRDRV